MAANPSRDSEGDYGADDGSLHSIAARWLARRDRGLTPAEQDEFFRWKNSDPRNAEAFSEIENAWASFTPALTEAVPALDALTREIDLRTRDRVAPQATKRPRLTRGVWVSLAAAAALTLATTVVWRAFQRTVPEASSTPATSAEMTYQVLPSDSQRRLLEDGSTAEIRGASEIGVEFTPHERRVRLAKGEVHFTVAKDRARPFIVMVGSVSVRAVGTAFSVVAAPSGVEVLVTEGRVKIDRLDLPAADEGGAQVSVGQRATVAPPPAERAGDVEWRPAITTVSDAEIEKALAWQSTRFVFNRTPLGEAVEAFNRHSGARMRLRLGDDRISRRLLGGTFRANNVDAFVRLIEGAADVTAQIRGDNEVVLWPAR